jgi:beta-phosphoglucomutase-like phosphatase (HAD superfamily)
MNIALDIDGVILNFIPAWVNHAQDILGKQVSKHQDVFDLSYRFNLSSEETALVWRSFSEHRKWANILPYRDAVNIADHLYDAGATQLSTISATHIDLLDQRVHSLRNTQLSQEPVHLTGCPSLGVSKHAALELVGPDMFVEDQLANLQAAKEVGIEYRVFMDRSDTSQSHPELLDAPYDVATHIVKDLHELVSLVHELSTENTPRLFA